MTDELVLSKDRLLAASRRLSVVERVDLFLPLREAGGSRIARTLHP